MKGDHLDSNYLVIETKIIFYLSGNLMRWKSESINKATAGTLFLCVYKELKTGVTISETKTRFTGFEVFH